MENKRGWVSSFAGSFALCVGEAQKSIQSGGVGKVVGWLYVQYAACIHI